MRAKCFICVCALFTVFISDIPSSRSFTVTRFKRDTELSEDYEKFLEEVKPTFEENLNRAFRNEAVIDQQGRILTKTNIHKLNKILVSVGDTKVELIDMTLPWLPDFRIININAELNKLCLDVGFKLGTLGVEGQYETNNSTLQRLLPISSNGRVVFTFKDVITKGRIGLLIEDDSFVPENYDIQFEWPQNETSVQYYLSNGSQVENKITNSGGGVDNTLVAAIWKQLNSILTELLHKQLCEAVVQFSVCETLADEDEKIRDVAKIRSTKANKIVDELLCAAKDYIVEKKYQSVGTPGFNVVFRRKLPGVEQGTFETEGGFIQDLSTLSRRQDLSLYEDENKLLIYGRLLLRELKYGYEKYSSKFESTEVSGSINTSVYRTKIFIKLSVEKSDGKKTLERIQVSSIDDIDVDVYGLGSLSWLTDKLRDWVIGNLRYGALEVLEKHIQEAFNYAIEKAENAKRTPTAEARSFWRPLFTSS